MWEFALDSNLPVGVPGGYKKSRTPLTGHKKNQKTPKKIRNALGRRVRQYGSRRCAGECDCLRFISPAMLPLCREKRTRLMWWGMAGWKLRGGEVGVEDRLSMVVGAFLRYTLLLIYWKGGRGWAVWGEGRTAASEDRISGGPRGREYWHFNF